MWQWGVAVAPSTWHSGCGSVGVGAWQRGSRGVAVWQSGCGSVAVGVWQRGRGGVAVRRGGRVWQWRGSGTCQVAVGVVVGCGSGTCHVGTATPYCHTPPATLPHPDCHTATPRLPHCHAPTATLPHPDCHVEGPTATPHCHAEGPSVPHRHTKTRMLALTCIYICALVLP